MINECGKCEYFIQHYGIDKDLKIFKINTGHCLKTKIKKDCQFFKQKTDNFEQKYFSLSCFFYKIYKQQNKLLEILQKMIINFDIK